MRIFDHISNELKRPFEYQGRTSIGAFWWFYITISLFRVLSFEISPIFGLLASACLLPFLLSSAYRRLNDSGSIRSWMIFPIAIALTALEFLSPSIANLPREPDPIWAFTAAYFLTAIYAFNLLISRSQPGPNQYGPNPHEVST